MKSSTPRTRDLVLVGGGHAHAVLLRMWGMAPLPGARLTLINPGPVAPYTGMLPGYVAGHYPREALDIDLVRLARFAGARLILDQATGLDPEARLIALSGRDPVAYDMASLDIGVSARPGVPECARAPVPVKPLQDFAEAWDQFLADVVADKIAPHVAVIGGGVGGVELALAMAHRLQSCAPVATDIRVRIIERAQSVLPAARPSLRRGLQAAMARLGVEMLTGVEVRQADADAVMLEDGTRIDAGLLVSAAGALPAPWLARTGLALHDGFVRVDPFLRSVSHSDVFAAGDIAHIDHAPREKAGVFAVRAGPLLQHNLQAALAGTGLKRFRPQSDYLKLVSLGSKRALAEKWGITVSGALLWRWKTQIDTRFMQRLTALPAMSAAPVTPGPVALGVRELEAGLPLCAGCGSKVGASALREALSRLPSPTRADILRGAGDDAAVLRWGDAGEQVLTTDHFRAFTEDPWLLGRITALHALGDVWAMGAQPQAVLASIILPPLSPALQARTVGELLAGARSVLVEAGADLVGGHTSQGSELTLGFTVTGLLQPERHAIGLDGLTPGDRLILTKPLGTGVILAAEMRGLARGGEVAAALAAMQRSAADAAAILRDHAHAMTDVTGFGLAGHLLAMLDASGCRAVLDLSAIPALPGAERLLAAGVRSSLHADNLQFLVRGLGAAVTPDNARLALLSDPQTAGGLLAGLAPAALESCLQALRRAGYDAAVIGGVVSTGSGPRLHLG